MYCPWSLRATRARRDSFLVEGRRDSGADADTDTEPKSFRASVRRARERSSEERERRTERRLFWIEIVVAGMDMTISFRSPESLARLTCLDLR